MRQRPYITLIINVLAATQATLTQCLVCSLRPPPSRRLKEARRSPMPARFSTHNPPIYSDTRRICGRGHCEKATHDPRTFQHHPCTIGARGIGCIILGLCASAAPHVPRVHMHS
eukprot:178458-Chlamydomonas_euryale.AAC.3